MIARRCGAVLFCLLVAVVLAEVGVRLIGRQPDSLRLPLAFDRRALEDFSAGRRSVQFDSEVGWVPSPNFSSFTDGTASRTNRAGMRADREYSARPPASKRLDGATPGSIRKPKTARPLVNQSESSADVTCDG